MEPVDYVCLRRGLLPHARRFALGFVAALPRHSELHYSQHPLGVCGNIYVLKAAFFVQPLCSLRLCGCLRIVLTTETQRTQRLHREEAIERFADEVRR